MRGSLCVRSRAATGVFRLTFVLFVPFVVVRFRAFASFRVFAQKENCTFRNAVGHEEVGAPSMSDIIACCSG